MDLIDRRRNSGRQDFLDNVLIDFVEMMEPVEEMINITSCVEQV